MPWPCFMVKSLRLTDWTPSNVGTGQMRKIVWTLPDGREVDFDDLPPGAMWHSSMYPKESPRAGQVPTLCVVLPGKRIWHMHHEGTDGSKWTIIGEPPNITATPSINMVDSYHGWVRDGVVSDDVEGRKFDERGKRL